MTRETNPVSLNHTNLSRKRERLTEAKVVPADHAAQVCRNMATRVRIPPESLRVTRRDRRLAGRLPRSSWAVLPAGRGEVQSLTWGTREREEERLSRRQSGRGTRK